MVKLWSILIFTNFAAKLNYLSLQNISTILLILITRYSDSDYVRLSDKSL